MTRHVIRFGVLPVLLFATAAAVPAVYYRAAVTPPSPAAEVAPPVTLATPPPPRDELGDKIEAAIKRVAKTQEAAVASLKGTAVSSAPPDGNAAFLSLLKAAGIAKSDVRTRLMHSAAAAAWAVAETDLRTAVTAVKTELTATKRGFDTAAAEKKTPAAAAAFARFTADAAAAVENLTAWAGRAAAVAAEAGESAAAETAAATEAARKADADAARKAAAADAARKAAATKTYADAMKTLAADRAGLVRLAEGLEKAVDKLVAPWADYRLLYGPEDAQQQVAKRHRAAPPAVPAFDAELQAVAAARTAVRAAAAAARKAAAAAGDRAAADAEEDTAFAAADRAAQAVADARARAKSLTPDFGSMVVVVVATASARTGEGLVKAQVEAFRREHAARLGRDSVQVYRPAEPREAVWPAGTAPPLGAGKLYEEGDNGGAAFGLGQALAHTGRVRKSAAGEDLRVAVVLASESAPVKINTEFPTGVGAGPLRVVYAAEEPAAKATAALKEWLNAGRPGTTVVSAKYEGIAAALGAFAVEK